MQLIVLCKPHPMVESARLCSKSFRNDSLQRLSQWIWDRCYKSLCRSVHLSHFCFFGILTPCPTSLRRGGGEGLTAPYTQVWQLVFFFFPFSMIRKCPKKPHRRKKSFAHSKRSLCCTPFCSTPLHSTLLCSALLHGAHDLVHKCNSVVTLKRSTCVMHKPSSHESILDRFEP